MFCFRFPCFELPFFVLALVIFQFLSMFLDASMFLVPWSLGPLVPRSLGNAKISNHDFKGFLLISLYISLFLFMSLIFLMSHSSLLSPLSLLFSFLSFLSLFSPVCLLHVYNDSFFSYVTYFSLSLISLTSLKPHMSHMSLHVPSYLLVFFSIFISPYH